MDKTEKLLPVTGADREAMDRLKRFADSPDATIGEHADIATVLALIDRLQSSARGGEVERLREALDEARRGFVVVEQESDAENLRSWGARHVAKIDTALASPPSNAAADGARVEAHGEDCGCMLCAADARVDALTAGAPVDAGVEWPLILRLRDEEADSVTILGDNPDGPPNAAVECCGFWTGFAERRFEGDTILAALRAAVIAKDQAARDGYPDPIATHPVEGLTGGEGRYKLTAIRDQCASLSYELGQGHEWGYRDVTDGSFTSDSTPFACGETLAVMAADLSAMLAASPSTHATDAASPAVEVLPPEIGRLHLGERRSDGERLCSHGHAVPAGHPLYWPQQISQYDDSDPLCLEHAIEQAVDDNGYCEKCTGAEFAASPATAAGSVGEGVRYPVTAETLNEIVQPIMDRHAEYMGTEQVFFSRKACADMIIDALAQGARQTRSPAIDTRDQGGEA